MLSGMGGRGKSFGFGVVDGAGFFTSSGFLGGGVGFVGGGVGFDGAGAFGLSSLGAGGGVGGFY